MAILTTSVSLGNSVLSNIKNKRTMAQFCMCLGAVLCSNIGFANLINYAYPLFGVLGVAQIVYVICKN